MKLNTIPDLKFN